MPPRTRIAGDSTRAIARVRALLTSLADRARDPAVRTELRDTLRALGDAVRDTREIADAWDALDRSERRDVRDAIARLGSA